MTTPEILACLSLAVSMVLPAISQTSQSYSLEYGIISQPPIVEPMKNDFKPELYPTLDRYVSLLLPKMASIDGDRKVVIEEIANYIFERLSQKEQANLTFICTHNSRRSQLSQLWAETAAYYYGLEAEINNYSGGTEITAFNFRAVSALERSGFQIEKSAGNNPRYAIKFTQNAQAIGNFSKKYDDVTNPKKDFAAIMTCSHADESCPFIPGAKLRIALPYDDPKASDGTADEKLIYDERCSQIALEMFYLINQVSIKFQSAR